LMLISRMCQGAHLSLFVDYKGSQCIQQKQWHPIVDMLWLPIEYPNVTINRRTRKGEQVIRPDMSTPTRWNMWVGGYGSVFGTQPSSDSGFWMGLKPNQTVIVICILTAGRVPWPVAHTSFSEFECGGHAITVLAWLWIFCE
jgi:hypothetical protein